MSAPECLVPDWPVPAIFKWLQATGHVPEEDMFRTVNMGIGLIIACEPPAVQSLEDLEDAVEIAFLETDAVVADLQPADVALDDGRHLHDGRDPLAVEFQGVADQVLQQLTHL